MRHAEFWGLVDRVFPEGGRSLIQDLALPELGSVTAAEALESHVDPQQVWSAICVNMDLPDRYTYLHRIDPKDRAAAEN